MPFGNSPQDALPYFSFGGKRFPVEDYEMVGGLRDHVHEYSHQDGGDPEKLGRKLYIVRATINAGAKLRLFPGLWPDGLNALMQKWELGASLDLVVPDIAKPIVAYAFGWTRKFSWKIRSGVKCIVEFREDATNLPLPITVSAPSPQSMQTTAAAIKIANLDAPSQSLISSLKSLVNSIQAIQDSVYLAGNQVLLQLQQVLSLCAQADQLASLQNANNVELMRSVHDLWAQAQAFANDIQQKNTPLTKWIVPAQMTIGAVSVALFGDSTHINDLLSLNTGAFNDPNQIPASTVLAYYPAAQNASSTIGGLALGGPVGSASALSAGAGF